MHPSSSVKQPCFRVCLPISISYFDRSTFRGIGCNHSELLSRLLLRFAVAIGAPEIKSSLRSVRVPNNESLQA